MSELAKNAMKNLSATSARVFPLFLLKTPAGGCYCPVSVFQMGKMFKNILRLFHQIKFLVFHQKLILHAMIAMWHVLIFGGMLDFERRQNIGKKCGESIVYWCMA